MNSIKRIIEEIQEEEHGFMKHIMIKDGLKCITSELRRVSKNIAEMSASSRKRWNSIIDEQQAGDLLMGFVS